MWYFVYIAAADDAAAAEEGDASLQSMPPNSVENLKFKSHFFEVIEELRMRRVCRTDSEDTL